ncbi:unnamed protein product [Lactuca virosa]|uniref:ABC-2 type transporter domain-containing protein n=1 Tax=Lactuca virosa TaxID=75947 RepID=A0AAU9PI85_9ASTR|nr:unnamed protein product [Lactuca virosa]
MKFYYQACESKLEALIFHFRWTIFSFYFRFLRDRLLCWVLPNVFLWLYTIGIWGQSTYEDATLDVAGCFSFALMMPML